MGKRIDINIFEHFTDSELIDNMIENQKVWTYIYEKHRNYCSNFIKKMGVDHDDSMNIYQDSTIVLYEKVKSGTFKLTCSIQTYLNSVCRNQVLATGKSNRTLHVHTGDFDENITDCFGDNDEDDEINKERLERILKAFKEMKADNGNCYEILRMFFYESYTMEKIAEHFGYTNADNAKNQKARCQKKLKKLTGII